MLKATDIDGVQRDGLFPMVAEDVRFGDRGKTLIDGVSLTLAGAGRTVIIGPNGAGKSLLLRLLHGLITPDAGTIRWGGRPMSDAVRKRQALVFQRPTLLRRSAIDNIKFVLAHLPAGERDARAQALLAAAGLTHIAATPARLLSGGEQQRLALSRALALEPDVLFLDEPSASLDPASTANIERMIADAADGGSKVVLVTHDMGQARRIADDVVFMHQGRIAETAAASTFFTNPASEAARAYLGGHLVL